MMKVYDELEKKWPHAKREWFEDTGIGDWRRVWVYKSVVEKKRMKDREVRNAGIQAMNF